MKNPVPASISEVDAIAQSSEHIAFIRTMLQKHSVAGARRNELFRQLRLAEHRSIGRVLRVAILGEFSSGKSTFINALIGQRLLKSARVATTASATFITYGPRLKVTATFLDGSCIQATAFEMARLHRVIARIQPDLPEIISIREAIDLLTADQAIANAVKQVDISLPSPFLQRGLSIIDTPGIGAGGDYTHNHVQITQAVVEQSADAIIVLVPSAQPMSNTLLSFLQGSAHRFLHRCIFVMTAMDTQTQADRQKTWSFVNHCLIKKLGLQNPKVYECGAIAALPTVRKILAPQQSIWAAWQQQFIKLEVILFQEIVRQRSLMISEKLVYLFQALLREVSMDMDARKAAVDEGLRQLSEQNSVTKNTLGNHEIREHQLRVQASDISLDMAELAQRQRQLKALNARLLAE